MSICEPDVIYGYSMDMDCHHYEYTKSLAAFLPQKAF